MTTPDDVGILDAPAAAKPSTGRLTRIAALGFCLCALLFSFLGLFEWDVPVTRFVRSLNDVHIDHLSNPWLAKLSDGGDRIGRGESLVGLSLVVLAVGYALKEATWKAAGWQSLLAHGMAAAISNLLKHLVGRPRPKFMHAGNVELSPAGGTGWDSFPSGHSSASFAMAAVFAARFPKVRWLIVSVATAVAASRVLRGSHYLTDAVGGAVVGYLVGTVASSPWRAWRQALESALLAVVTPVTALLVLFSTLGASVVADGWLGSMVPVGGALVLAGAIGRLLSLVKSDIMPPWWSSQVAHILVGGGFGLMTGSALTIGAVGCAGAAQWLYAGVGEETAVLRPGREVWLIACISVGFVLAVELRGIWPIR